jgi:hypothetical protein
VSAVRVARCSRFPARGGNSKRRHEARRLMLAVGDATLRSNGPCIVVLQKSSGRSRVQRSAPSAASGSKARTRQEAGGREPSQGWNTPGAQAHGPQGAKGERRVGAGRSSSRERPRDRRTSRGPFVLRHGRELRSDWRWKVSRTAEAYVLHGTPAESVLAAFELSHRTRDRDSKSERAEEATGISAALTHERPPGGKRRGNLNRRRSAVRIAS